VSNSKSSKAWDLKSWLLRNVEFAYRTCIFDVSGVITDANLTFLEKLATSMQFAQLDRSGIGFQELIVAFGSNAIPDIMSDSGVPEDNQDVFWAVWQSIPENVPGRIKVFPEVVPVLHVLRELGVTIRFASRLYGRNLTAVFQELQRMGYLGEARHELFGPVDQDERMGSDCMHKVLVRALKGTPTPRMYVDDTLDRMATARDIDADICCVGSTRGFFGRPHLVDAGADKVISNFYDILPLDEVEEEFLKETLDEMGNNTALRRMWEIVFRRRRR